MEKFKFGRKSLAFLAEVHPDLQRVAHRALELTPFDFGISEGKRDLQRQKKLFESGKSWTMASKHLPQDDGYSHALDFFVIDERGSTTWKPGYYRKVMQAFVTAAIELGVKIEFGGLWKSVFDGPHVEYHGSI